MSKIIPNKPDVFDQLSPAQINSVKLLAAGKRAKEVAAKVDVTPQTVSLWMNHDQNFRLALWLYKKEALDAARSELQLAATEAVTVVRNLLHESSSEQVRLRAAQLLLDQLGLVGNYSADGFDGAVITPIGNYAPPDRSAQSREAYRHVRNALDSMRRRLGVVNPNNASPVESRRHAPEGISRYGPLPTVVEIHDSILDKARLEFLRENVDASLKNGPPTSFKMLAERHDVDFRIVRDRAAQDDWIGQLGVMIASQAGGSAT